MLWKLAYRPHQSGVMGPCTKLDVEGVMTLLSNIELTSLAGINGAIKLSSRHLGYLQAWSLGLGARLAHEGGASTSCLQKGRLMAGDHRQTFPDRPLVGPASLMRDRFLKSWLHPSLTTGLKGAWLLQHFPVLWLRGFAL